MTNKTPRDTESPHPWGATGGDGGWADSLNTGIAKQKPAASQSNLLVRAPTVGKVIAGACLVQPPARSVET